MKTLIVTLLSLTYFILMVIVSVKFCMYLQKEHNKYLDESYCVRILVAQEHHRANIETGDGTCWLKVE